MIRRFLSNYLERHRHPGNQLLHAVGLPLTFLVPVILLFERQWWWAAAAFAGGYLLQFAGHAVEGNDAGEVILVKRAFGKPYREFGPRSKRSRADE